ncbi:MAG: ABC transporter ATP-binding protein [Rikenellaceae bacterium]|nr:ABC transporter ATP-binding protein [Rikenellaceae bacterium]
MIRLENLSLGYADRPLLKQVSATFAVGQLTALIGRNGSGKSTLLRTIAGLDDSTIAGGSIRIAGTPQTEIAPHELSKSIAFVTTERVRIANLRCRDVVALGRAPYTNWIGRMQEEDRRICDYALEAVGMAAFADRTMDRMSDGECQRVMIARALAQETPIMLLDEPTSFLDLPNRYELGRLLQRLAHEERKCILFSTHELDIARSLCDAIALVDNPHLHHLPIDEMQRSGHIERCFNLA